MNTPFVYKQGWNDERKLLMKLSEIMQKARYIQKRGKNQFHKYNYVTEADVNEKIGEMLSERNIVFIPNLLGSDTRETTTARGNTEYIIKAKMEFTFMDAETGESITTAMEGEGQDPGDKAIYKAVSGTQKYVLLKFFMLASGDDPEADEGVDQRNAEKETVNAPDFKHQKESSGKAALKAKWDLIYPDKVDKFEEFYTAQKEKYSDAQINAFLTKKLTEVKNA